MTVSLRALHVLIDDADAALGFYCGTLGLSLHHDLVLAGYRRITLATASQPEIAIVLSHPHAGRSQASGNVLAALIANGELCPIHLRSDDLAATFDSIAAAPGAEVWQEPIRQPAGVHEIVVRDPAGNVIRIEEGGEIDLSDLYRHGRTSLERYRR
jgi:catechol 2,3-dioxygenase-like lactoylglutathione lyase family enzyme